MASCDLKITIPKLTATPNVTPIGQLSAFNGFLGESESNIDFKIQSVDPEPYFFNYKDIENGSGKDGVFLPSDENGNTVFSSNSVLFTQNATRLIINSGKNEGTYKILGIPNDNNHQAYIIRDNNPIPPPDLSFLFKTFSFIISGAELKSPLNPNYGKDVIDQVIKIFDGFMPFLMMYKFFLPILKLFICIIEIFCAMPNPIKVAAAVQRLFRDCIPLFLSLFPIVALILMIINVLVLLVQIILYIILLILNIVDLIRQNINVFTKAIDNGDAESILAAAAKIGRVICLLQNIFVALLMVNLIFKIFKDLLKMLFSIPPCDSSDNSSFQNCCTPDVCPQFIKNGNFTRSTGSARYISECKSKPENIPPEMQSFAKYLSSTLRSESFQFYDDSSDIYEEFANIISPNDPNYSQYANSQSTIFFPTDASYNKETPPNQSPYLVDIKFLYKPSIFGRDGYDKLVIFKDCIVTNPTTLKLLSANGKTTSKPKGVIKIAGGLGFESDGVTELSGYSGGEETGEQATLETFLFLESQTVYDDTLTNIENKDFIDFENLEYSFKINHKVLVSKNLITYSCLPEINQDRSFTNNVFSNELNVKIAELQNFPFPDIDGAINCVNLAIDAFTNNITDEGAQTLGATATACMQQLKEETENAIKDALPLAFDPYKSDFSLQQEVQFTTDTIKVNVDLKEASGSSITNLLPQSAAEIVAKSLTPSISFGEISEFKYNGTSFEAEIFSPSPGSGTVEISFDNKKISKITPENTVADLSKPLTVSIKQLNYQFIYAQSNLSNVTVGTGDSSDGTPIRDGGDISRA